MQLQNQPTLTTIASRRGPKKGASVGGQPDSTRLKHTPVQCSAVRWGKHGSALGTARARARCDLIKIEWAL